MRALRLGLVLVLAVAGTTTFTLASPGPPAAAATDCAVTVGPGIPPPASVPSGVPGFHAAWYGQSGYPTMCPGQLSKATVAFYNSGSLGWQIAPLKAAYLGTWSPVPGQDRSSILGGDGRRGSPNTRWPVYNRPAAMPGVLGSYVGPGQVAWFQFTVKAPPVVGTYRLYIRPLIEGVEWMEDFGVFWQVTAVPATSAPERVTVANVDATTDVFSTASATFRYDRNDVFEWSDALLTYEQFEFLISGADVVDMRYEPASAGVSSFNIVSDFGHAPPAVNAQVGDFDGGTMKNDVSVTVTAPASNGSLDYAAQRAVVPAGTTACSATSGSYEPEVSEMHGSFIDRDLPSGTYCYRSGANKFAAQWSAFGYSAPATVPGPP
jgi:hypothetical protein